MNSPTFRPGERVRYRNVNLHDREGIVESVEGKFAFVRWNGYFKPACREWTENLETFSDFRVNADNAREFEPHKFSAFASDLGLAPGQWPATLSTDLGNGNPFLISHNNGEGYVYLQQLGCIRLVIFND